MNTNTQARDFAILHHGDQEYGDQPYSVHLDAVANIARTYGNDASTIAYLHDVVEDTELTLDDITKNFGLFISQCVAILTDEPGANRRERKIKTYQKMAQVNEALTLALIVKAADRLANLRACQQQNNKAMLATYREEHPAFKQAAYRQNLCEPLWQEMETLINPS